MEVILIVIGFIFLGFIVCYFSNTESNCSQVNETYTLNQVQKIDFKENKVFYGSKNFNATNDNIFETDLFEIRFDKKYSDLLIFVENKGYNNIEVVCDEVTLTIDGKCINTGRDSWYGRYKLPYKAKIELRFKPYSDYVGMFFDKRFSKTAVKYLCERSKIGDTVRVDIPIFNLDLGVKSIYSFEFILRDREIKPLKGRISNDNIIR